MQNFAKFPLVTIFITSCILIFPSIWHIGFGDIVDNTVLARNFASQLWAGNLYPRWLINMVNGCGDESFYFTYPLQYYLISAFAFLGNIMETWQFPILCQKFLLMFLGGFFCYRWFSSFLNNKAALLGALAYISMPYTIYVFYSNFMQDYVAVSLLPLVIYSTKRLVDGRKYSVQLLSIAFAAVALSSIRNSVIIGGLSLACSIVSGIPRDRGGSFREYIAHFIIAIFLAAGLASFYYLPLAEMALTSNLFLSATFNPNWTVEDRFLFPFSKIGENLYKDILGVFALLQMAVIILLWANFRKYKEYKNRDSIIIKLWFWVAVAAMVLLYPISSFLWNKIIFITIIYHPFRFAGVLSISLAVMTGFAVYYYGSNKQAILKYSIGLILLINAAYFLSTIVIRLGVTGDDVDKLDELTKSMYENNITVGHAFSSPGLPGTGPLRKENLDNVLKECSNKIRIIENSAEANVIKWQPGDIIINTKSDHGFTARIGQFYHHLWRAKDENGDELKIERDENFGMIIIKGFAGEHNINLYLEKINGEISGAYVSSVAVILFAISFLYGWGRFKTSVRYGK